MGKSWKGLVDERAQADHSMKLPDRREQVEDSCWTGESWTELLDAVSIELLEGRELAGWT